MEITVTSQFQIVKHIHPMVSVLPAKTKSNYQKTNQLVSIRSTIARATLQVEFVKAAWAHLLSLQMSPLAIQSLRIVPNIQIGSVLAVSE